MVGLIDGVELGGVVGYVEGSVNGCKEGSLVGWFVG